MAEAVVDGAPITRFFCHKCSVEIERLLPVSIVANLRRKFNIRLYRYYRRLKHLGSKSLMQTVIRIPCVNHDIMTIATTISFHQVPPENR